MVKVLLLRTVYCHNLTYGFFSTQFSCFFLSFVIKKCVCVKYLPWVYQETVMALGEVRQGGIFPVEAEASLHRLQIPPRAMMDCLQNHDRLLLES